MNIKKYWPYIAIFLVMFTIIFISQWWSHGVQEHESNLKNLIQDTDSKLLASIDEKVKEARLSGDYWEYFETYSEQCIEGDFEYIYTTEECYKAMEYFHETYEETIE